MIHSLLGVVRPPKNVIGVPKIIVQQKVDSRAQIGSTMHRGGEGKTGSKFDHPRVQTAQEHHAARAPTRVEHAAVDQ